MQSIDSHFTKVREKIAELGIIDAEDIIFEKFRDNVGRIHGRIFFRDGSMLEFLEMITLDKKRERPRYRFHWQDNEGNLIIRWDNAKHHPEVNTHPNHKHVKAEGNVESSNTPGLIKVLEEINNTIIKGLGH